MFRKPGIGTSYRLLLFVYKYISQLHANVSHIRYLQVKLCLIQYLTNREQRGWVFNAMAYKGYFQMTKEERLYKDWGLSCKHVSGLDLKDGARLLLKMDRDCFFIKRFWKVIATIPKNEICNISMGSFLIAVGVP